MKKMIALAAFVAMTLSVTGCLGQLPKPGASGLGDSLYPMAGNGGYDAQHYTINLTVDMNSGMINSAVQIESIATQNLNAFNLDFAASNVTAVVVDDHIADFNHDDINQELTIELPGSVKTGETFITTITYQGVPTPSTFTSGLPYKEAGWIRYEDGVYVVGQLFGSQTWYPVNDHPSDKASYTIRITVPKPYVAIANGVLQGVSENETSTTYVWESTYPMASWMVTVNIAEFIQDAATGPDNLPVRYFYTADLVEDGRERFAQIPAMLDFFSGIYGPYPFDVYGAVLLDIEDQVALEAQTLALHANNSQFVSENVVAHEVAHQWFGNSVTPQQYSDVWLNEGFATYSEALWIEHTQGQEAYDTFMIEAYQRKSNFGRQYPPPGSPESTTLFNTNVYFQGAVVLHALRLEVGDDTFFQILRTYYDRFKYGNASTADFISVAEDVSGRDLEGFFDLWLYAEERPPYPTGEE